MEIRLLSREEACSLLSTSSHIYTRYVLVSSAEIVGTLPGVSHKVMPMSWLIDAAEQVEQTSTEITASTSDIGWFCTLTNGTLSLTLDKSLFSISGLQCKKSRDMSRDLYTFSCDIREPITAHNRKTLSYCFDNVLKHEYTWSMGNFTQCARDSFVSRVALPVAITTHEDLQEIVDAVGATLLGCKQGSPDNVANTFTVGEFEHSGNCWLYTSDTCITGREMCDKMGELGESVRFVTLFPLPSHSKSTKHITLFFSGKDDVYLLQYEVT